MKLKHQIAYVLAVALVLTLAGAEVFGQDEQVSKETIEKLIVQLSDNNWHVREEAQKRLALIGAPVAPFLKEPSQSAIFEVRFRAKEILQGIRFVAPDNAAAVEKAIKEFDPKADKDKLWRLLITLRRIKNVRFYLLERMLKAKGEEREKVASLLARLEYGTSGRRIDGNVSYAADILLSLVRDELVGAELRLRTLRTLKRLDDKDSVASLMDWLYKEEREADIEAPVVSTLESLTGQPKESDGEDKKARLKTWWSENANKPEFVVGRKHLEIRRKFEEKEAQQEPPFLGVAKDQDHPDLGGAHVLYPVEKSGAGKAGVQSGDVIVEFDGRPVDNWDDMVYGLKRSRIGQKILLKVRRGEKEIELQAVLTRRLEGE